MSANPHPELSLHGLSITPERPLSRAEPLPAPAAGFRFLRELGRGGMGVVYAAQEEASGRQVAVKIIAQRLDKSPDAIERFEREARLAASISHPNCVFVYGAHVVHGAAALSMELMSGQSLEERLRSKEPIPIETAVAWGIEILDGLGAAHALGIVHRDVKPSNCFLTANGHVKVGDFGLSRSLDGDLGLTQSGAFIGSPLYASPEQVRGRAVDHRADIYSVGATLYALVTGRPPHSGSSLGEVLAQILSEAPPSPSALRPGLPRGLEKIVLRALAKDPKDRFPDCAAFRRALLAYMPGSLTPATLGLRIGAYIVDSMLLAAIFHGTLGAMYLFGFRFAEAMPQVPWVPADSLLWPLHLALVIGAFSWLEARFGTTPGKRLLGLRVVGLNGGRVPWSRTALRAATFFAPYALPTLIFGVETRPGWSLLPLLVYLLPLLTMRKRNGYRGIHEFASGTRVLRALPSAAGDERAGKTYDPVRPAAPGVPPMIGPYTVEGLVGATARGTIVIARDPGLDRSVWIHLGSPATDAAMTRNRAGAARPMCLRWIHHGGHPIEHDVYESPGGAGLAEYVAAAGTLSWGAALPQLVRLAGELEACGEGIALEQIWVDRSGRLRVLDFVIGESRGGTRTPIEVLAGAASLMLAGAPPPAARLPQDLPVHADEAVRRLLGFDAPFATLGEARSALERSVSRPSAISRWRRAGGIALVTLWLLYVAGAFALARHMLAEERAAQGKWVAAPTAKDAIAGTIMFAVMFCVPSLILAFALRGGLTFTIFGIRVRNRSHALASRWRCLLRATVVCLPVLLLIIPALPPFRSDYPRPMLLVTAGGLSALLYLGGAIWSLVRPYRGPADIIARTRLVPR